MAGRRSSNQVIVPESRSQLNSMKLEIAEELGLIADSSAGVDTEFGGELGALGRATGQGTLNGANLATRDAGSIGGMMTRRLIQQAEHMLNGLQ